MKTKILTFAVLTFLFIVACQTDGDDVFVDKSLNKEIPTKEPQFVDLGNTSWSFDNLNIGQDMSKSTTGKSEDRQVVLYMAEYLTTGDNDEMGNIVYFNSRGNKQLGADFVPDSQYNIFTDQTNDISYYVDQSRPSADLGVGTSTQAIERSMTTWDEVTCSELSIIERPYNAGINTGVVAGFTGHGPFVDPIYGWVADVVHAGWMPLSFFDAISGGNGGNILGVTFTFVVAIDGEFSDDDDNGKLDVWFREIYYNDEFQWTDGGTSYPEYDVETVALHEAGHGLSQGHFGKAFSNKGGLHFAPRAVMNAAYSGVQTDIEKTDEAGHCSNWAQWPNN